MIQVAKEIANQPFEPKTQEDNQKSLGDQQSEESNHEQDNHDNARFTQKATLAYENSLI